MKRSISYIVILLIIALGAIYVLKPKSRLGQSIHKRVSAVTSVFHNTKSTVSEKVASIGKPDIKLHAINFEYPPEYSEVPLVHDILREKYNIVYDENDYDILITGFLSNTPIPTDPEIIKIHYTAEAHIGDPKQHLSTHDLVLAFDFLDHPNYTRVPFSYARNQDKMRHDYDRGIKCDPASKKEFACFLVSNSGEWLDKFDGGRARNRLFHQLSLYKRVASGGKHLNNMPGGVPVERGKTQEWLSQCKFIIAYENQINYPGYVTEKPFQAWFAGGIPIYHTHISGMQDMNPKAVIYGGDFATEEDLIEYIKKVDNDDELYCKIWNEHILIDPSKDYEVFKDVIRKKVNDILDKRLRKR